MSVAMLLAVIGVLALAGFVLSRQKALASAGGNPRELHSLPNAYGWHGAIWVLIPALATFALWLIVQPMVVENRISANLPTEMVADDSARLAAEKAAADKAAAGKAVAEKAAAEKQAEDLRARDLVARIIQARVHVDLGGSLFEQLGGFAEDMDQLEDWNLWTRYECCKRKTEIFLFAVP